jgi:hypothetical protein
MSPPRGSHPFTALYPLSLVVLGLGGIEDPPNIAAEQYPIYFSIWFSTWSGTGRCRAR